MTLLEVIEQNTNARTAADVRAALEKNRAAFLGESELMIDAPFLDNYRRVADTRFSKSGDELRMLLCL